MSPAPDIAERLRLLLSLVRRDYAIQFAGTALGLVWLIIQYVFQIAVFYLIFGYLLAERREALAPAAVPGSDYLSYLLGGMVLWLPVQDMLLRACGILTENRALIRRTSVGADYFVWVPVAEALLHYAIIFLPVCAAALLRGNLAWTFPLAFLWGAAVLLFLSGWAFVLARVSALLKDVSPLMRLLFQIVFWCTPIVYPVGPSLFGVFAFNPVYVVVEIHRGLLFDGGAAALASFSPLLNGLTFFVALSLVAYVISAKRLSEAVSDHI